MFFEQENVYLIIGSFQKTDISVWENLLIYSKIYLETYLKITGGEKNFCLKNASLNFKNLEVSEIFENRGMVFGIVGYSVILYFL